MRSALLLIAFLLVPLLSPAAEVGTARAKSNPFIDCIRHLVRLSPQVGLGEWSGPHPERARELWTAIQNWKLGPGAPGSGRPRGHVDLRPAATATRLPAGIPPELQPGFDELNRIMADNPGFVKWMIALEIEAESELAGSIEDPVARFEALRRVIRRRAASAGWPDEILILAKSSFPTSGRNWRTMLRQGHLFIDPTFSDLTRFGNGMQRHTAGAHLLQLLYASEALNKVASLRASPAYPDGKIMPTLMRFMGDGYEVNGRPYRTSNLKWGLTLSPKSLWVRLFDATPVVPIGSLWRPRNIKSPETQGLLVHALPFVSTIERWAEERTNYRFPDW